MLYTNVLGGPGSPHHKRRPTSSSSAPSTPDIVTSGRAGSSANGRRAATRQPGQTAGVLVQWPGKKEGKEKEDRTAVQRRNKKVEQERRRTTSSTSSESPKTASKVSSPTFEDGPATSPSYNDNSSNSVHPRSPTSKQYQHRRYAQDEEDGVGKKVHNEEGDEEEDIYDDMDHEIEKQTMQIDQLEKWGKSQGFRKTESPPPTPRREMLGDDDMGDDDMDEYRNINGVAGARERGERGILGVSRKKTGVKRGSGRGSPNAPDGRSDEEYHPTGSNFVVPSTDDTLEDDDAMVFRRIPRKKNKNKNKNSSKSSKTSPRSRGSSAGSARSDSRGSSRGSSRGNINAGLAAEEEIGAALLRTDQELIDMLKIKPKRVPQLRTEEGFQSFFNGIEQKRMRMLLERAYEHLKEREREKKVRRRLKLLEDQTV